VWQELDQEQQNSLSGIVEDKNKSELNGSDSNSFKN